MFQEPQIVQCLYGRTQDGDFGLEENFIFALFVSFLLQGLETVHAQGATQFLSKSRGGPSLVSVGAGTGRTYIVNILLPNSMLLHHVITGKVYHQRIPVA